MSPEHGAGGGDRVTPAIPGDLHLLLLTPWRKAEGAREEMWPRSWWVLGARLIPCCSTCETRLGQNKESRKITGRTKGLQGTFDQTLRGVVAVTFIELFKP